MEVNELLYEQLKTAVKKLGERIEQKERNIFPKLAVTNLSEVLKNDTDEEVLKRTFEINLLGRAFFNVLLLIKEEELLKMRKKKWILFRSNIVPKALLRVIVDSQKVICTIYDPAVPEGVVKEGLKNFVRSHKEIKEFVIDHKYR